MIKRIGSLGMVLLFIGCTSNVRIIPSSQKVNKVNDAQSQFNNYKKRKNEELDSLNQDIQELDSTSDSHLREMGTTPL